MIVGKHSYADPEYWEIPTAELAYYTDREVMRAFLVGMRVSRLRLAYRMFLGRYHRGDETFNAGEDA